MIIDGITILNLPGHSINHIGVITSDNICFAGDAYTSNDIISKYSVQYTYDIEMYLNSMENLLKTNYDYYVPAHGIFEEKNAAFNFLFPLFFE